jgi:hypothetical protein
MIFAVDYNWPEEELQLIAAKFVRQPMAIFHDYVTALKEVIRTGTNLRTFIGGNPDIRLSVSPSVIESISLVANNIIFGAAKGNVERVLIKPKANDKVETERPKQGLDSIREALGLGPEPPKQPLRRI